MVGQSKSDKVKYYLNGIVLRSYQANMTANYFAYFSLTVDEFSHPGISAGNPWDTFDVISQIRINHIQKKGFYQRNAHVSLLNDR